MATIANIDHAPTVSSAFRAVCFVIASPRRHQAQLINSLRLMPRPELACDRRQQNEPLEVSKCYLTSCSPAIRNSSSYSWGLRKKDVWRSLSSSGRMVLIVPVRFASNKSPSVPYHVEPCLSGQQPCGRSSTRIALAPTSIPRAIGLPLSITEPSLRSVQRSRFVGARTRNQSGRSGKDGSRGRRRAESERIREWPE